MPYTEQERRVFAYTATPGVVRHADPLAAHFALVEETQGQLATLWGTWCSTDAQEVERAQAGKSLATASRIAFDLASFWPEDGTGATDSDALRVLEDYFRWAEGKGQGPGHSPTC